MGGQQQEREGTPFTYKMHWESHSGSKQILSLNSGQNGMSEEEYKNINEVLYFLMNILVLCMEKFRFYLPWKDSSAV